MTAPQSMKYGRVRNYYGGNFVESQTSDWLDVTSPIDGALLSQVSLLAAASLFWWCVAGLGSERAWHAIAALLVTGKIFCLVAVILTFAPRPLYHMMSIGDQQLAGLVMITLCPLTYVASALWLCRRWLLRFDFVAAR